MDSKYVGPTNKKLITILATVAASLVQPTVAFSQGRLEEIVVTAQKRAQSLQDVPIAISAFSEELLQQIKAVDVSEIALRTPNFRTTQFGVGEPQYNIRGVGSTSDSAASDPTVPVFVDEVYIARPAASNFDFFDLERVEVLRGPQGTLFGRNTTGGAISVTTKKPSFDQAYAKVQGIIGNFGSIETRAVGNLPISDNFAIKGAISRRDRDGYATDLTTGVDIDNQENVSARIQALWAPSDTASWLFSLDIAEDDNGGNARTPVLFEGTPLFAAFSSALPEGGTIRVNNFNPDTFNRRDTFGGLIRGEFETGIGSVTSITGYRESELNTFEDIVFQPVITNNFDIVDEDSDQFSQEFRLASNADAAIQWIAGVYYFEENIERFESFDFLIPGSPLSGNVAFGQDANSTSAAVFGQATFSLSNKWALTAGLRYTDDEKEIQQTALNLDPTDETPGVPLFPGQPFDVGASESFDAVTGKLSFEYTSSAGNLFYISYNRGFKSGFFPSQGNSISVVTTPLPEEIADSFEVGFRTDLLNDRLRLNGTAFYVDYEDLQQFALVDLVLETFNVDAEISGLELEATIVAADWLDIGISASALDSEITGSLLDVSLNGNELPTAETSVNVWAAASFSAANGTLRLRSNFSWTDEFFNNAQNLVETVTPSYGLLDARVSYVPGSNENFEVALWGKNLTDEDYQSHIIPFGLNNVSLFGPPRTYGVSVTYEF